MHFQRLLMILMLFPLIVFNANAAKPNLVLLPIDVSEQDADLEAEYGAALQEGLQNRYTVFYGAAVEKELEKEYSKVDCDAETCNQNVAIAFNGELVADGAVKRIEGGYLLKLVVRNVLTSQVVETKTYPCRGCDSFSVMGRLKTLGRGLNTRTGSAGNSTGNNATKADVGGKAIFILDSVPSGASITINDKQAGKTPYQGLNHQIGDNLLIELKHSVYKTHVMEIGLEQAITQLQPIELEIGQTQILITVQPFKADTLIYVDGQAKGVAPLNLTLSAGSYEIKANHKGRDSEIRTVNIESGSSEPIALRFGVEAVDGQSIKVAGINFEFVDIPAGSFRMGSNTGDSDEKPVHRVNIPAFSMMKTEVTQGQWQAIMGNNPAKSISCGDSCPVESVNWDDVQDFIGAINKKSGKTFRLPSEAEWEYAARAGSKTKYSWGNDIGINRANCTNKCGDLWDRQMAPVASYQPNTFGLYDMHGNVWEWTQDCWNDSYRGAPSNGSAWDNGDCDNRVVRGGSWSNSPGSLTSSTRYDGGRTHRSSYYGFRLIQSK
jgi:formylglycine-generating enzyme required for sulfatase activity